MTAISKRALSPGQLWILIWLAMMPLLSVDQMARLGTYNKSFLYHQLKRLEERGLVLHVRLGMTTSVQSRWFLTSVGIQELLARDCYVSWAATERGIRWLTDRLPAVEQIYTAAVGLWSILPETDPLYIDPDPEAEPLVIPLGYQLTQFRWMRGRCVQAVGTYGDYIRIPFQWVGLWTRFRDLTRRWKNPLAGVEIAANVSTTTPLMWVICAVDDWAAVLGFMAAPLREKNIIAMITPTHVFRPVYFGKPSGRFSEPPTRLNVGCPEDNVRDLEKNAQLRAVTGMLEYKVFAQVQNFSGATCTQIARLTNETVFHVGSILENQRRAGLYVVWGGGYHLTDDAMVMASKVSGVPASALRTALRAYLPTDSSHRDRNQLHDRDVVDLVIECKGDGMEVAGPRRGIIYLSPAVQVKPDAVIGYSRPGEVIRWAFLELERGKRTPAGVHRKVVPYRKLRDAGYNVPVRVVCTNKRTADLFVNVAPDLDLLAAVFQEARKGRFFGAQSVWRNHNGPADFA